MRIPTKSRQALLATVAATILAAVPAVRATAEPATTDACPDTAVFEAAGHGPRAGLPNWGYSEFNAYPPAGWQIAEVPYHDGVFPGIDEKPLAEAVADGVGKLDAAVRDFHARCFGSRLVLAGYSERAVGAGGVLQRLARSDHIPHVLINGVLYGPPRQAFGEGGP